MVTGVSAATSRSRLWEINVWVSVLECFPFASHRIQLPGTKLLGYHHPLSTERVDLVEGTIEKTLF